jgi:putative thioredoxin
MSAHVIDVSTKDFQTQVIEASKRVPVLVDFWAPWCGPCRSLGPILERLAAEYGGRFILAKVNSDENQPLAAQFGVRGIPNVKAFSDGRMVDEFTGALPEAQVREFLERLLPSPAEPLRQQALAARSRGDDETARKLLHEAIDLDVRNEAALLDLMDLMLDKSELEDARRILDALSGKARDVLRFDALQARLELASQGSGGADRASLEAAIARDPADLEARFQLASQLALKHDYEPAMAHLIEIVRRDRSFRDDGGRKTLVNLFNLLGGDHDLVRRYRSELSAALNR